MDHIDRSPINNSILFINRNSWANQNYRKILDACRSTVATTFI